MGEKPRTATSQERAEWAQRDFFVFLCTADNPSVHATLAHVNSVLTTAAMATQPGHERIWHDSDLFAAKHPVLCRDLAENVVKTLHGDRDYSQRPFAHRAYSIVADEGTKRGFTIRSAEECERMPPVAA